MSCYCGITKIEYQNECKVCIELNEMEDLNDECEFWLDELDQMVEYIKTRWNISKTDKKNLI